MHYGRSFHGHKIEDECPCPKAACGLVDGEASGMKTDDHGCREHTMMRTIRQAHKSIACPARKEAWETENANIIIMGTHDKDEARDLILEYYTKEIGLSPEELESFDVDGLLNDCRKFWVNRHHPGYEEEIWDSSIVSDIYLANYTPYLISRN